MFASRFGFSGVLVISLVAGGCAAESYPEGDVTNGKGPVQIDESDVTSLRSVTAFAGKVGEGGEVTVEYRKDPYIAAGFKTIPFLAYEITAEVEAAGAIRTQNGRDLGAAAAQQITVRGDFPSQPRVLVVDESFRVLAAANATTGEDGHETATLSAPKVNQRRFVLIRDGRWSMPMTFDIRVTR